jgi:acetyl-CoA acetyltransferase
MDVYVLGMAVHPARRRIADKRLEELVFDTTRAALDDAGVERAAIEQVTIAACDELDGRSISSMLLAMPAGAYLKDEIKCTDSGLTGLCLGAARTASGFGDLGLVVSWSKSSTAPFDDVMRMRAEPFYLRPVGMNNAIADGLFAGAVAHEFGLGEDDAAAQVLAYQAQAARNPRAVGDRLLAARDIAASPYVAAPLRRGHMAPVSDGAVALVLASGDWLARHPTAQPLARLSGFGWASDSYALGRDRLTGLASFRKAFGDALAMAGIGQGDLDAVELDAQTGWHAAAYARALDGLSVSPLAPSGGPFAQNPYFCTGLNHVAEAVLQVSGRAGPVQLARANRIAAHGCHGYAQQGNAAVIVEGV